MGHGKACDGFLVNLPYAGHLSHSSDRYRTMIGSRQRLRSQVVCQQFAAAKPCSPSATMRRYCDLTSQTGVIYARSGEGADARNAADGC